MLKCLKSRRTCKTNAASINCLSLVMTYSISCLAFACPSVICLTVYKTQIVDVQATQCLIDLDNVTKKKSGEMFLAF